MPLLRIISAALVAVSAPAATPEWVYLQNDHLKAGVRRDAGACLGFLAAKDGKNVLNSYDHGRFVQQSYYGRPDGSFWVKNPWRYNPVQGGDYKGNPAAVLEFKAEPTRLYSKTRPKHWATGADIPEMEMEQWLELKDAVLHLRIKMKYSGTEKHPAAHQEIPAVFVEPDFATLLLNDGKELRRWQPGWPNEHVKLPEHWAAYLDDKGQGVGVLVPAAAEATCYRFGKPGDRSACSYIAPLTTFALEPGKVFEYDAWLTIGTEAEIRERLTTIRDRK